MREGDMYFAPSYDRNALDSIACEQNTTEASTGTIRYNVPLTNRLKFLQRRHKLAVDVRRNNVTHGRGLGT